MWFITWLILTNSNWKPPKSQIIFYKNSPSQDFIRGSLSISNMSRNILHSIALSWAETECNSSILKQNAVVWLTQFASNPGSYKWAWGFLKGWFGITPYPFVLDFWKIKFEKSSSMNWIFNVQKSIPKLIFAGYTGSKKLFDWLSLPGIQTHEHEFF